MSYCSSSRQTRFTVLYFNRWAYSRNICTAHAQKRLHVNFRCKFRHRRSTRRPRFAITVQNFVDLATFSVDFCILFAECPLYFYFRFVWPSDLESTPHASTPTSIIPASVFVCWYVTWPSDLVYDFLNLNSWCTWRVTWSTLVPSLKTLPFLIYDL